MVSVIKGKGPDTKQQNQTNVEIENAGFGSKAAMAALQETKTQKAAPAVEKVVKPAAKTTESKESRRARKQAKSHEKSVSDQREETTRKIIGANRGSITGAQVKSNLALTKQAATSTTDVADAWEDPNEVTSRDDETTALEKRLAQALELESQIESQIDTDTEIPIGNLNEVDGLNGVTQPIRDFANYGSLMNSPDLIILMSGISESFDNLLEQNGIQMPDAANLDAAQIQEIFSRLNLKKKKSLSEEEKEAELILAGAVAILAVPKIEEKLSEMGLMPKDAESLHGILKKLIEEVKQDDHPYHYLYTLIKEETEYSIVPEDPETASS